MKKKRSIIKRRKSLSDRRGWEENRRGDDSLQIRFKDSVNPDDYHYLSTKEWDEQSVSARRLRDALRWVAALKKGMT